MSGTTVLVDEPPACDWCAANGVTRAATVDGATTVDTRWSHMCEGHFALYGRGLGVGKGQRYVLRSAVKPLADLSGRPMGYGRWTHMVDRALNEALGAGMSDLPDMPWRDWYDQGLDGPAVVKAATEWL